MPSDKERLSHCVLECKHHVVWIPKCGQKRIFGSLQEYLGEFFHDLARQKECRIAECRRGLKWGLGLGGAGKKHPLLH